MSEPGERSSASFELLAGRGHSAHDELEFWHGNIGQAVALDLASPAEAPIQEIDLLCWNVAIGRAFLDELFARLRQGDFGPIGTDPSRPFVLLLQEVYRADPSVPEHVRDRFHGGHVPLGTRRDIVSFAADHNLSLRYMPSMRNGQHRSDRGNAILANVAIRDAHGFTLPYVRQRRVVVNAELDGVPGLTFASAHLDTSGRLRGKAIWTSFSGGRAAQVRELVGRLHELGSDRSFIIGADLNTAIGIRDPAFLVLHRAGFLRAAGSEKIRHTFHGPVRMLLDHVLYHSENGAVERVEVIRLDETPADRDARVFGSDHHPLLARIRLRT